MTSLGGREEPRGSADDKSDRLYQQPRQNIKIVRILTVLGYVFCVSSAAIMLSLYYVFLWDPYSGPPESRAHAVGAHGTNMSALCAAYTQKAQRATHAAAGVQVPQAALAPSPTSGITANQL
ncbi:putative transmembrane protein INAFM2 [Pollicipes pollicipes]|uniref:putative transmembrane protein INAFM2 n=1 Tax=Pollicipes pollicipes TaxID=41117 RepID=UPI0018850258|nr:putative transmembrane protein INAFM2 [Pollicipes pollicipes]